MWPFIWRYVVVPLLVWLLTHSYEQFQFGRQLSRLHDERATLLGRIEDLRAALRRRDEDDRRPFPFRPRQGAPVPELPDEVVGDRLKLKEGL